MLDHLPPSLSLDTNLESRPGQLGSMDSSAFQFPSARTNLEWKLVLSDVKREYLNRKYRHCASRCRQLLDTAKADVSSLFSNLPFPSPCKELTPQQGTAKPAHLIYLHFYAASALEMQAKGLPSLPAHRSQLLQQARDHYRRAAVLTEAETAASSSRVSRFSSVSSSLCSPVFSEVTEGTSTRTTSPFPTLVSEEEDGASSRTRMLKKHHRKQVSFGDARVVTEPFVRPDSPTLGFDEWLGRTSPDPNPSHKLAEFSIYDQPSPLGLETRVPFSPTEEEPEMAGSLIDERLDEEDRRRNHQHAIRQYSSTLSFLQQQVTKHLSAIDEKVTDKPAALSRQASDEMRQLELEARIVRLKANGWQRKRFDASKYEALREAALADLS